MTLYLLVLMAILTHLGFAGSRLAVPLFAVDQGAGPFGVGTIVALYAALPAVLALPMGRMADRVGYKIPLLCGACGIFTALLLPWLFPKVTTLYFAASLLGVSFMTFQLSIQTLVGGIAGPEGRARNFSLLSLGYASANFCGPLVAGVLIDTIGHARTFAALSIPLIPAIVLAAMGARWIPNVHAKSETVKGSLFELLKIKTLRNTLITSGIVSSAWDVYQFVMPIYGHSLGMSATAIGLVLSALCHSHHHGAPAGAVRGAARGRDAIAHLRHVCVVRGVLFVSVVQQSLAAGGRVVPAGCGRRRGPAAVDDAGVQCLAQGARG